MAIGLTTGTISSGEGYTTFTIEVLGGVDKGKELVLSNRCLPYRPYALPSSIRNKTTYYAGNPTATIQVLGSQRDPTQINGFWKQRFMLDGSGARYGGAPIYLVSDLVDTVQRIHDAQQHLEVRWGTTVRRGIMSKFTPTWHYGTDVKFDIDFTWTGDTDQPMPFTITQLNQTDPYITALVSLDETIAVSRSGLPGAPSTWLDSATNGIAVITDSSQIVRNGVNAQLSNVRNAVATTISAANALSGAALLPADIGNALAITATGAVADLKLTAQDIAYRAQLAYRRLWENITSTVQTADSVATSLSESPAFLASQYRASVVSYNAWVNNLRHMTLKPRQTMVLAVADNRKPDSDILAIYIAKEGDDLRRVSVLYYNTPSGWQAIMQRNHLSNPILFAGQVIIVPKLS